MNSRNSHDAFHVFAPLMAQCEATCSPEEFYWHVNDAYHTVESEHYDRLHASMFMSLEKIWTRLLHHLPDAPERLDVLDVGSGTGLVGRILNRLVPERIGSLTCVEPNRAMIEQARLKSNTWLFPVNHVNGELSVLPNGHRFDVVTINSVLHHIVDLNRFLGSLSEYVKPGGVLLTAQDPCRDAVRDPVARQRRDSLATRRWLDPAWFGKAVWRRLGRLIFNRVGKVSLEDKVNDILIKKGVMSQPLAMASIYAVTDVHVPNQPGNIGNGIDVGAMERTLSSFNLAETFTYQFFGAELEYLTFFQRRLEQRLWHQGDPHGFLFGTAWRHRVQDHD